MTWNPHKDDAFRTITITVGNAYAIARELSRFDMEFGPEDFVPFLKARIGCEYEIRMLMEEALHWGFHTRVEAITLHNLFVDEKVQISIDDDGDFEYMIFDEEEQTKYNIGSTTRRITKSAAKIRCMKHPKYKGVRLTKRAKQCPACVEVYQHRQGDLEKDNTDVR